LKHSQHSSPSFSFLEGAVLLFHDGIPDEHLPVRGDIEVGRKEKSPAGPQIKKGVPELRMIKLFSFPGCSRFWQSWLAACPGQSVGRNICLNRLRDK